MNSLKKLKIIIGFCSIGLLFACVDIQNDRFKEECEDSEVQSPTSLKSATTCGTGICYDEITLLPTSDLFVRGGAYYQENYGQDSVLMLKSDVSQDYQREIYFRFDLPRNKDLTINDAVLKFYVRSRGTTEDLTFDYYHVADDRVNETFTWETIDVLNIEDDFKINSTPITISSDGWKSIDITNIFQSEISTQEYTTTGTHRDKIVIHLKMCGSGSDNWAKIWSREWDDSLKPRIVYNTDDFHYCDDFYTEPDAHTGITQNIFYMDKDLYYIAGDDNTHLRTLYSDGATRFGARYRFKGCLDERRIWLSPTTNYDQNSTRELGAIAVVLYDTEERTISLRSGGTKCSLTDKVMWSFRDRYLGGNIVLESGQNVTESFYSGFALKIDDVVGSIVNDEDDYMIWQMWGDSRYLPPLCICLANYDTDNFKLKVLNRSVYGTTTDLAAGLNILIEKGEWHELVIGYAGSKVNQGWFKLWMREASGYRKLIDESDIQTMLTRYESGVEVANNYLNCQIGVYRYSQNHYFRMFLDDIRYGSTYSYVSIGVPEI